jgi:hypothetical protein
MAVPTHKSQAYWEWGAKGASLRGDERITRFPLWSWEIPRSREKGLRRQVLSADIHGHEISFRESNDGDKCTNALWWNLRNIFEPASSAWDKGLYPARPIVLSWFADVPVEGAQATPGAIWSWRRKFPDHQVVLSIRFRPRLLFLLSLVLNTDWTCQWEKFACGRDDFSATIQRDNPYLACICILIRQMDCRSMKGFCASEKYSMWTQIMWHRDRNISAQPKEPSRYCPRPIPKVVFWASHAFHGLYRNTIP